MVSGWIMVIDHAYSVVSKEEVFKRPCHKGSGKVSEPVRNIRSKYQWRIAKQTFSEIKTNQDQGIFHRV